MLVKNNGKLPSVNALVAKKVQSLVDHADALRLHISTLENGTTIVDAGVNASGGLEAGRRIAEICLGGLGRVQLRATSEHVNWSWSTDVYTSYPVIACLLSQYAGWSLSHGSGRGTFNALGSGPARAMGSKEALFKEMDYQDTAEATCLIIECSEFPPVGLADKVAEMCGIAPDQLTLILASTSSLSGSVQVVARVLETALHKAHVLGFDICKIVDGAGSAPICPPSKNFMTAMSRTNDAILFAGQVHLFIECDGNDAKQLAEQLPSSVSKDYGKPFGEIFKEVAYDFYRIDKMLFAPATVAITSLISGETFHAGKIDFEMLNRSFSN